MAEPTLNDVQLLAEAVLALAEAVRDAPPPVYNITVQAPEHPEHPIAVTVIERERDDTPPAITVPVTVQPAPVQPAQVVVQEAPESPDAPMPTEWAIVREEEYPYKMVGLRAVR